MAAPDKGMAGELHTAGFDDHPRVFLNVPRHLAELVAEVQTRLPSQLASPVRSLASWAVRFLHATPAGRWYIVPAAYELSTVGTTLAAWGLRAHVKKAEPPLEEDAEELVLSVTGRVPARLTPRRLETARLAREAALKATRPFRLRKAVEVITAEEEDGDVFEFTDNNQDICREEDLEAVRQAMALGDVVDDIIQVRPGRAAYVAPLPSADAKGLYLRVFDLPADLSNVLNETATQMGFGFPVELHQPLSAFIHHWQQRDGPLPEDAYAGSAAGTVMAAWGLQVHAYSTWEQSHGQRALLTRVECRGDVPRRLSRRHLDLADRALERYHEEFFEH